MASCESDYAGCLYRKKQETGYLDVSTLSVFCVRENECVCVQDRISVGTQRDEREREREREKENKKYGDIQKCYTEFQELCVEARE